MSQPRRRETRAKTTANVASGTRPSSDAAACARGEVRSRDRRSNDQQDRPGDERQRDDEQARRLGAPATGPNKRRRADDQRRRERELDEQQ